MPVDIRTVDLAPVFGLEAPLMMAADIGKPTQEFIFSRLSQGEVCDPPLTRALTEFLEPGDTFVDIGSHIGYYALLALAKVGPAGQVIAFEPHPETFPILRQNAKATGAGNFRIVNCALAARTGVARLHLHDGDEGRSSLFPIRGMDRAVEVNVITLDSVMDTLPFGRVGMMKIDVEGMEEEVLKGASRFLTEVRPRNIVFEVLNAKPRRNSVDKRIRWALSSLGYECFLIRPWSDLEYWDGIFAGSNYAPLPEGVGLDLAYGNILARLRDA